MDSLWQDVRLAVRALWRSPTYAIVAIVTLALGIGATTTLFAVLHPVLIKPLPYPDAGRIVSVSMVRESRDEGVVPDRWYHAWRDQSTTLAHVAVYVSASGAIAAEAGEPQAVVGVGVSEPFFRVMGTQPTVGRVFRPDEFTAGNDRVIVLGHGVWSRVFGADSGIVGREVSLGTARLTVVGVMPPGFTAPANAEYWRPTNWGAAVVPNSVRFVFLLARLKAGAEHDAARAEMTMLAERADAVAGVTGAEAPRLASMSLRDRIYGSPRRPLMMLAAAVAALLLIACANVANLSLARAIAREGEFGVRSALGARRSRIARLVIAESTLLGVAGGAAALLFTLWALPTVLRFKPASLGLLTAAPLSVPVLAFTASVALICGVALGLGPAITGSRLRVQVVLAAAGARATSPRAHQRLRRGLVVAQIGATLALVAGASLLARSLGRVLSIDVGFDPRNAMIVDVTLPVSRYASPEAQAAFFADLEARVRALPTVSAAGVSGTAPLRGFFMTISVRAESGDAEKTFALASIGPDYPGAIGLRLHSGRVFTADDRQGAGNVVLMSASAARLFFPDGDAVGQSFPHGRFSSPAPATVVGVVSDVPQRGLEVVPVPQVYQPLAQTGEAPSLLVVRATTNVVGLSTAIRNVVREIDPQQAVRGFTPLERALLGQTTSRRFSAAVAGLFAALALALASVGLYGVVAYQLARRTREFGVRLALGADGRALRRLIMREALGLSAVGIVAGLALALIGVRGLRGLLFQVGVYDPVALGVAPAVLALVALVASYLPARRAAQVDPSDALRAE